MFPTKGFTDQWDITEEMEYVDVRPDVKVDVPVKKEGFRGPASLAPYDASQADKDKLKIPTKFSLIATNQGYIPQDIYVPLNTEVELSVLTNELESCFVVSDLGIRMGLKKGKVQTVFIPAQTEAKIFEFHCAINKMKGKIVFSTYSNANTP